jgi:hypothetical protein
MATFFWVISILYQFKILFQKHFPYITNPNLLHHIEWLSDYFYTLHKKKLAMDHFNMDSSDGINFQLLI